jgi:uncharacterized protein RhaS with RHS repeats
LEWIFFDWVPWHFISEDAIGLKSGSNLYAYVNNNPSNFIDPIGEWPEKVHRQIFQRAFPGLTDDQINAMMDASNFVDSFGGYFNYAPAHGNSDGKMSEREAAGKTDEFIQKALCKVDTFGGKYLRKYDKNAKITLNYSALYYFGMAGHTRSDMIAPGHLGYKEFNSVPGSDWVRHWANEQSISSEQLYSR